MYVMFPVLIHEDISRVRQWRIIGKEQERWRRTTADALIGTEIPTCPSGTRTRRTMGFNRSKACSRGDCAIQ